MHGMQVVATLKENDPSMEIHVLVRDHLRELVKLLPFVDGIIPFERESGLKGFLELRKRLRSEAFDYVLDFHGLARTGLMSWICKAPNKIGRADAREGATLFYKQLVPLPNNASKRHTVEKLLEFCRVFGFSPELKGEVKISDLEDLKEKLALGGRFDRVVSIIPHSSRPEREWPHFAAFIKTLSERLADTRVLVLALEHQQVAKIEDLVGSDKLVDLQKGVSMVDLARALQVSDLSIGVHNDLISLAASLGTRTTTVIGKSNILFNGPYPANTDHHQIAYSPKEDLKQLSISEVLQKAESQLYP